MSENERLQRDLDYWVGQAMRVDAERRKLETALQKIDDIVGCTGVPHAMEYSPDKRFFHVRNIAREALGNAL